MKLTIFLILFSIIALQAQFALKISCNNERSIYYNDEFRAEDEIDVYFIEVINNKVINLYVHGTTYELYYPANSKNINRVEFFKSVVKDDSFALSKQYLIISNLDSAGFELETDFIELKKYKKELNGPHVQKLSYKIHAKGFFSDSDNINVIFKKKYESGELKKILLFHKIKL